MRSVLIVEDDPTMLRGLEDNFAIKGYTVTTARDGEQGKKAALQNTPDLVILDIMLPGINGYELCGILREKKLDMPIIMVTAKDQESDIVLGLNLGADDYVTKPFSIKELLARAEALMRRMGRTEPDIYEFADFRLDITTGTLTKNDQTVKLGPKEYKILHLLVRKQGCVLTQDEILNAACGYTHFISSRSIDKFVNSIKSKIEPDPDNPIYIHTIAGVGYKFEPIGTNGNHLNN